MTSFCLTYNEYIPLVRETKPCTYNYEETIDGIYLSIACLEHGIKHMKITSYHLTLNIIYEVFFWMRATRHASSLTLFWKFEQKLFEIGFGKWWCYGAHRLTASFVSFVLVTYEHRFWWDQLVLFICVIYFENPTKISKYDKVNRWRYERIALQHPLSRSFFLYLQWQMWNAISSYTWINVFLRTYIILTLLFLITSTSCIPIICLGAAIGNGNDLSFYECQTNLAVSY